MIALAVLSCETGLEPAVPQLDIRFSGTTWVETEGGVLPRTTMTVENVGTAPAWVERCGERMPVAIDRRRGFGWEGVSGRACAAINDMSPISLEPGESRSQPVQFLEGEGLYRVRLAAAATFPPLDLGGPVPVGPWRDEVALVEVRPKR